jgi:hypothetical protein
MPWKNVAGLRERFGEVKRPRDETWRFFPDFDGTGKVIARIMD